jgi:hypothetical protein
MKAKRAYELRVTKGPRLDPDRVDHIEVLEIASGEVVLFWDTLPDQTRKLSRALRRDLSDLDADAFLASWRRYENG